MSLTALREGIVLFVNSIPVYVPPIILPEPDPPVVDPEPNPDPDPTDPTDPVDPTPSPDWDAPVVSSVGNQFAVISFDEEDEDSVLLETFVLAVSPNSVTLRVS